MTKGNPNDESRQVHFVAKAYDPVDKQFKPLYIAPEATNNILGDVYLSDATNGTESAATGVTAATPKAVKTVQDNANNKLDKTTSATQSVRSDVTFAGKVTGSGGFAGNLTGDVTGNASTATQLKTARTISVKSGSQTAGSATFNGTSNISITIPTIDGTTIRGTIPLASIPQGALERVVHVANQTARYALTTSKVQLGDTVIQDDTGVMYIVVDESKLSSAAGYEEYSAATATNALHADAADVATKLQTARTIRTNLASTSTASFDGSANVTPGVTGTLPIANGGTGGTTKTAAVANLLGGLSPSGEDLSDGRGIARYVEATGVPSYFTGLNVWNYIKTKADPLYAAKSHTHSNATTSAAGFLPKLSGSTSQYLRGDGTWATVQAGVTGVKGNAETSYRTGNVNLTPANIGAAAASHTHNYLPLTGGTLTGNLSSRQIAPSANGSYSLGTSSLKWSNVYATTFTGNLNGNATTATSATTATTANRVNKTLTLTGTVTGSVSLNANGTATLSTTLANPEVVISEEQPTNSNAKIWVKI